MKTAIIGLPMVGKTSLFTILTGVHEATRVGSMEARIGVTKVPDSRLQALAGDDRAAAEQREILGREGQMNWPGVVSPLLNWQNIPVNSDDQGN